MEQRASKQLSTQLGPDWLVRLKRAREPRALGERAARRGGEGREGGAQFRSTQQRLYHRPRLGVPVKRGRQTGRL